MEGLLPDDADIPYVHGRDLVPIRRQPRRYENRRHELLFAEEDAIRSRIRELDQQLIDLAAERRQLLQRIRFVHDQLRPCFHNARGRRRRSISHEERLPPAADDAVHLSGRALRAICLTLLQQAGRPLTLREIHVLLHRMGYLVAHDHPAKALADALGHEADAGRAERTRRATYAAVSNGHAARLGRHPLSRAEDDRAEDNGLPSGEPGGAGDDEGAMDQGAGGDDPGDDEDLALPDW